jgi:hypothetical protein
LELAAEMAGANPDDVEFEGNTEFAETTLTAQDVASLTTSWMQGAISHESLLENFIDAGLVSSDKTPKDEIATIEDEKPALGAPTPPPPGGAPPGQEDEDGGDGEPGDDDEIEEEIDEEEDDVE